MCCHVYLINRVCMGQMLIAYRTKLNGPVSRYHASLGAVMPLSSRYKASSRLSKETMCRTHKLDEGAMSCAGAFDRAVVYGTGSCIA